MAGPTSKHVLSSVSDHAVRFAEALGGPWNGAFQALSGEGDEEVKKKKEH